MRLLGRGILALALAGATFTPAGAVEVPWADVTANRWVSATDDATAIFVNPAGLAPERGLEGYFEAGFERDGRNQRLAILSLPLVRFGYLHDDVGEADFDTYAFGTGISLPPVSAGWTTRILRSDDPDNSRATGHDAGLLFRPIRAVSAGFTCRNINKPGLAGSRQPRSYAGAVSVRPLRSDPERLTATIQADWRHSTDVGRATLAAEYRILDGLRVQAHYATRPREGGVGLCLDFPGTTLRGVGSDREGSGANPRTSWSIHAHSDFRRRSLPVLKRFAEVKLEGPYEDQASGLVLLGARTHSARRAIQLLQRARDDGDVAGAVVTIGRLGGGLIGNVTAIHQELREALFDIRRAGKPVVVWLEEGGGAPEAYVASAADWIVMPRLGGFSGIGVAVELLRLREAFARLGIEWDARTAGEYKTSFHTTYTDSATAAQREEIESLVHEAYRHLDETITASRRLTETARRRILSGGLISGGEALDLGLIDEIGWYDDARRAASRLVGGGTDRARLLRLQDRHYWRDRWTPPPAVGVVLAGGSIASGEGGVDFLMGGRTMGAETVARAIRSAAGDPTVKAIVLRVDSGGGAALASDAIRREILETRRRQRIPIFVSMGNMAASGGYWISMDADLIVANPLSITGSIGVASLKPVVAGLLAKRDVRREVFKEGEYTDMFSLYRPMTEEERRQVGVEVDGLYSIFLDGVAAGRRIPREVVEASAGGRVWLGSQAVGRGLVDSLGTLDDAVRGAARAAGIERDYRTLYFTGTRFNLLSRLTGGVEYLALRRLGLTAPVEEVESRGD